MLALGFSFQKGRIRLAALRRQGTSIVFQQHRVVRIDAELPFAELMDRYVSHFRSLLNEFAPEIVASRQIWESTSLDAAISQTMPPGLLAYVCQEQDTSFVSFTPQALRQPGPFALPRGTRPITAVDAVFGQHSPHWDDVQRAAVLVAWRALIEG